VGRAFAALKLREIDGIYGGELAGHYYFRDFYYSDSGILACLLVLRIVKRFKDQGKKVSEIINKISNYANSGEINFIILKKESAMEEVKNYFTNTEEVTALYDFDGYRLEFKDWWFNIRQSNTEPYIRLLVEAVNKQILGEKVNKIKSIIQKYN
jgi:phosphomannomutase